MDIKVHEQLPKDAKYIRRKVFMEEQGFENEFDAIDDVSIHILILENSKTVATCRIYFSEERKHYVVGRIAVLKEFRGKDYGAAFSHIIRSAWWRSIISRNTFTAGEKA